MTIRKFSPRAIDGALTRRETEVTKWLAEGKQGSDVAIILGISPKTVEVHRYNSMRKLGAENWAELTRAAIREGIVPCPCRACVDAHLQVVAA